MTDVDAARRRKAESRDNGNGSGMTTIVSNMDAQAAVIGAVLTSADLLDAASFLRPSDFYGSAHPAIWDAVLRLAERGDVVTTVTVAEYLRRSGEIDAIGGPAALITLQGEGVLGERAVGQHARLVAEAARYRRLQLIGQEVTSAATQRNEAVLVRLLEEASGNEFPTGVAASESLDAFLVADESEYDWVIPDLIERHDRVILTGLEGKGKSTLLRQVLVTTAAGLHPFTLTSIDPVASVLVDCENSRRHLRRKLRPMSVKVHKRLVEARVHVISRPEGIDLLSPVDAAWLSAEVRHLDPDLLLIGPLYKLAMGDPCEEEVAATVAKRLDELRVAAGCALILEAHSPHPSGSSSKRPTRPYGASLWMRWPEFGLHLEETGELQHWRGDRDEREWPVQLRRGGEWPWTVDEHGRGVEGDILRFLEESGLEVTGNQLADGMKSSGYGRAKAAVLRSASDLVARGEIEARSGTRGGVLYKTKTARLETSDEDF